LFLVVMVTVLIVQGVRKIPIQFAKRMVGRGTNTMPIAGARDYIPLKVNAAGVMPIIFAQALMFLPAQIAQWFAGFYLCIYCLVSKSKTIRRILKASKCFYPWY